MDETEFMKPTQILLDLDGVLSNFLGLAIQRLNKALNRDEPVPEMDERMFAMIGNWSIAEVYAKANPFKVIPKKLLKRGT